MPYFSILFTGVDMAKSLLRNDAAFRKGQKTQAEAANDTARDMLLAGIVGISFCFPVMMPLGFTFQAIRMLTEFNKEFFSPYPAPYPNKDPWATKQQSPVRPELFYSSPSIDPYYTYRQNNIIKRSIGFDPFVHYASIESS